METLKLKHIIFALALVIVVVGGIIGTSSNDDQSWQILQKMSGEVEVKDQAGYYWNGFGRVWTYPRNEQVEYDKDFTFNVTFNDGGQAKMNAMVRFSMPLTVEKKREFHRQFGGNMTNVEASLWAHLSNAMKSSGPVMSASEHQSARQSEFNQLVWEQLNLGLYETRKVQRELHDQFDDKGKPITVYATEVVLDDKGKPKVANVSPLATLGITVTQFNVTHIEYDEQTRKQFASKKEAFLAAENSKAQREKEVQERLMVEEKGRREKAESEAVANKRKAEEVINAQRMKEVAELDAQRNKNVAELDAERNKKVAETDAARQVAVALLEKQRAETDAAKLLAVATLNKQTAEQEKAAQIARAEAQQESLKIAGAISERDRVLAEIAKDRDIGVAEKLSKVNVPQFIIGGGQGGSSVTEQLLNLRLLEATGVLQNKSQVNSK